MSEGDPVRPTARRRARAAAGFSFIEILVVMGIIAVLVGVGIGVYTIVTKKTPEVKARALLSKMRANIEFWRGKYKAYPPSDFAKFGWVLGAGVKLGKATPANVNNPGVEALYQSQVTPGYGHNPDLTDAERCNTDEDRLDKAFDPSGDATLWEIKDPWDNPLVYFTDGDYAAAEKAPPTYVNAAGDAVSPRPYRTQGGGFAQPSAYQLYSMGPDGQPNTDDDLKAWESN